jgi:hypothetical protein
MDSEQIEQLTVIYEQLSSLLHSFDNVTSGNVSGQPITTFQHALSVLQPITGHDLTYFLPTVWGKGSGRPTAEVNDFKTQINAALGWISVRYFDGKSPSYRQAPVQVKQADTTQDPRVAQGLNQEISKMLIGKRNRYGEGTKEQAFIEKVLAGLPKTQTIAAILVLITESMVDFQLAIDDLNKILT